MRISCTLSEIGTFNFLRRKHGISHKRREKSSDWICTWSRSTSKVSNIFISTQLTRLTRRILSERANESSSPRRVERKILFDSTEIHYTKSSNRASSVVSCMKIFCLHKFFFCVTHRRALSLVKFVGAWSLSSRHFSWYSPKSEVNKKERKKIQENNSQVKKNIIYESTTSWVERRVKEITN